MSQREMEQLSKQLVPIQKNSLDLICVICGARAHGFNFDQVTCESCKTFFRRNALKDLSRMKCRYSGNCLIDERTRRSCSFCRLEKCFNMKMRKDWIRTEEEKQLRALVKQAKSLQQDNNYSASWYWLTNINLVKRRKRHLIPMENVQMDNLFYFGIHRSLSETDRVTIDNIVSMYLNSKQCATLSHFKCLTRSTSLIEFLNAESVMFKSLIIFLKGIPHFHQLNIADQILLVKRNSSTLIHLHHILISGFHEDPILPFLMGQWVDIGFAQSVSRTRKTFDCFVQHPEILKLVFVVLMFSTNLSPPHLFDTQAEINDSSKVLSIQNFYIDLFWNYLDHIFKDENSTRQAIQTIVLGILRYQSLMSHFEDRLCAHGCPPSGMDPLLESVFRLT